MMSRYAHIERAVLPKLLSSLNIMDYSLLLGVHDLRRGNMDNIRDNTLQVFSPKRESQEKVAKLPKEGRQNIRQRVFTADPVRLEEANTQLPSEDFLE